MYRFGNLYVAFHFLKSKFSARAQLQERYVSSGSLLTFSEIKLHKTLSLDNVTLSDFEK